ncbi:hypothetical protein ACFL5S_01450 [Fibrobacterota bacterium]
MHQITRNYIIVLRHTIMLAHANHNIWLCYKKPYTRRKYLSTMNRHLSFFSTSLHAHFVAMIIALYRLLETKKETVNLNSFLKVLKEKENFDRLSLGYLKSRITRMKPSWLKVNRVRNNIFAHRRAGISSDEIFRRSGLSYKDFRQLIRNSFNFVEHVVILLDDSPLSYRITWGHKATLRILEILHNEN